MACSGTDEDDLRLAVPEPLDRGGAQVAWPALPDVRCERTLTEQDRSGAYGFVHGNESGTVCGDPMPARGSRV